MIMKTVRSTSKKYIWLTLILFVMTNCGNSTRSQQPPPPDRQGRKIQIALLLDTSNSMDGLIEQAKSQLWNIVNELARARCEEGRPILQIALYEYGNDNLPQSEGFIRLVTPLTSDLDELSKDLFSLTTNGGDEYCGEVIHTALKQLKWTHNNNDLQLIYIAGNEPFTQGKTNYRTSCLDAREKNVVVNTIFCGAFQEGINTSWKNGADLTGGSYASIEQNRKTVYISSPYDDRIAELNNRLNQTYIPYGTQGRSKQANQRVQDNNAQSYGKVNAVKRAVSKSSHVYNNKTWDLVDASEDADFEMEELKEADLPEEMQKMDKSERKAYVEEKKNERAKIQKEIQELNTRRIAYVTEKRKEEGGDDEMLEKAVLTPLKSQAKQKGFIIEE
jgi:signal recognition particle subunit SEC65